MQLYVHRTLFNHLIPPRPLVMFHIILPYESKNGSRKHVLCVWRRPLHFTRDTVYADGSQLFFTRQNGFTFNCSFSPFFPPPSSRKHFRLSARRKSFKLFQYNETLGFSLSNCMKLVKMFLCTKIVFGIMMRWGNFQLQLFPIESTPKSEMKMVCDKYGEHMKDIK